MSEAGLKMNTALQAILEQLKRAKEGHENQQRQTGGLLRRIINPSSRYVGYVPALRKLLYWRCVGYMPARRSVL
jgi:hypothetical protein